MYPFPYPPSDPGQPLYSYHPPPPGLYSSHQAVPSTAVPTTYSPTHHLHNDKDGVRTVYVTNLPPDTSYREVHNLFRLSCPGFEACKFGKDRSDVQVKCAFASFVDRAAALRAVQTLNRYRFDPSQPDLFLRVEFAKTDDRSLTSGKLSPVSSLVRPISSDHQLHNSLDSPPLSPQRERESTSQLPPCATLFISGFISVSHEELRPLFESTPGFVRFAMGKDGRHAFVSYVDIQTSSAAMTSLNGTRVGHLAVPLSITYAKKVVSPPSSGQL